MGPKNITPISIGCGFGQLNPPWLKTQVEWLGRGIMICELFRAGRNAIETPADADNSSRWLLGAGFPWKSVLPHEKTFRRSVSDKWRFLKKEKMNPWPVHLASLCRQSEWEKLLKSKIGKKKPDIQTDCFKIWKFDSIDEEKLKLHELILLDGHHSRSAQKILGTSHVLGWVEPFYSDELRLQPIHRAGWLGEWLVSLRKEGLIREVSQSEAEAPKSGALTVLQPTRKWFFVFTNKAFREKSDLPTDCLVRLAKGKVTLRSHHSLEELEGWLESLDVDTVLVLQEVSKDTVYERAKMGRLFPQKATYFYPKIPFGLLVENLS